MIDITNCTDFDMVGKTTNCVLEERERNIRCIGFYKASTILPSPLTSATLKELIIPTDTTVKPALVFSQELANVTLGEPQMTERKLSDSRPTFKSVESREITFQDRLAVTVDESSKAVFKDYEFWKDKKEHSTLLNYVIVMSDGSLIVPRKQNSNQGMPASFNVFLNYESKAQGGAFEFKQGSITFLGDPMDFVQPEVNLNDIPEIAGKW